MTVTATVNRIAGKKLRHPRVYVNLEDASGLRAPDRSDFPTYEAWALAFDLWRKQAVKLARATVRDILAASTPGLDTTGLPWSEKAGCGCGCSPAFILSHETSHADYFLDDIRWGVVATPTESEVTK